MKNEELDPKLIQAINRLNKTPERDPQMEARGRANFLNQATSMISTVSRQTDQRHNGWFNLFQRKEHIPIMNTLIAIVVTLTFLFGGTGATVYASQGSLPGQILYPVKTIGEDTLMVMSTSTQTRLKYLLNFTDRRIQEISGLLSNGQTLPESLVIRLRSQLEQALQLAAHADPSLGTKLLEQVRLRAQTQEQLMTMLMTRMPESDQLLMQQVMLRIQEQVRLCLLGESDLPGLMILLRQQDQNRMNQGSQTLQPGTGNQTANPMMNGSGTPMPFGNGNGSGSEGMLPSKTPMPSGSGSGSGGMMPSGTPGQYGSTPHNPSMTPQPGGGNGHMP